MGTTATGRYDFEINEDGCTVLGRHASSGLATVVVQGICNDKDGNDFDFVARNNLDLRYPERFKVNWNGSKARMPEAVGHGMDDETKEGRKISDNLYMTRGARIAIARKCIALFPLERQMALGAIPAEDEAEVEVEAEIEVVDVVEDDGEE